MLVIYTDSDCDFIPSEIKQLGVKMISMPYIIGEDSFYPYQDEETFDFHTYYERLRKGLMPKTNALSPLDYINYFEEEFKNGNDIFYIHFSSAMTGTFNSMNIALDELKEKYPDRKFYHFDTKAITILSYIIAKDMIKKYNEEHLTPEQLLQYGESIVDRYAVYFYADDLKFFGRSGRISNFSAIMGNIIGLHPILTMTSEGKMCSISKARGKLAINKLIEYVEELGDNIKDHEIVVGHADAMNLVNKVISLLKEKFGEDLNISIVSVNPTAGAHCGPDTVGIAFRAIHR